jgi:hypothetical protein
MKATDPYHPGPSLPFIVFTPRISPSDIGLQAAHSMQDAKSHPGQFDAFAISSDLKDLDVATISLDSDSPNSNYQQLAQCARDFQAVTTSQDKRSIRGNFLECLPRCVQNRPESPETLLGRFEEQVCPLLSATGGQNNIWQKSVLQLVRSSHSQTLYHSISAVTALHISKEGALHDHGRELMSQSLAALDHEIEAETPSIATLATILLIAFWTRWDEGLYFGKKYIIGALSFLQTALSRYGALSLSPGYSYSLFALLYDTCSRMDSLSRVVGSALATDYTRTITLPPFDEVFPAYSVPGLDEELQIDPWMGYVRGLYPLIGRAADLCDKVRTTSSDSPSIITEAESLEREIEAWSPDTTILLRANGYSMDLGPMNDIIHMAEAYRYATILYLHQIVPEIPGTSIEELSRKVINRLSAMRSDSRITIVQNYPLFLAGCEVRSIEKRKWVKERWTAMMPRMNIKNVNKCLEITQEVWRQRDAYQKMRQQTGIRHGRQPRLGYLGDADEEIDPDIAVKGRPAWASVMKDLNWAVSL